MATESKEKRKKIILAAIGGLAVIAWCLIIFDLPGGSDTGGSAEEPEPETEETASQEAGSPQTPSEPDAGETEGGGGDEDEQALDPEQVATLIEQTSSAVDSAENLREKLSEGRNPFRLKRRTDNNNEPEKKREQPKLDFELTSIFWDEKNPMALINGRVVSTGDKVGKGIRVSSIEPEKVTLRFRYWGRENNLRLRLEPK